MKYFFDTEFMEDGKTIDLISIGIVAEDGRELYRESREVLLARANDFVRAHVLPQLGPYDERVSRREIREAVLAFVGDDPKPQFVAYYADYDWVVLCQLFGRMIDLPKGWPKYCLDLKQLVVHKGADLSSMPQPGDGAHHALADARWCQHMWDAVTTLRWDR